MTGARPGEAPLISLVEALAERAARHPARDALIAGARHVSYGEFWERIVAVAHDLAASGVRPGDRVLLAAPSVPEFAYGYFGAHLLGAVAVPLDPNAPQGRLEELIQRAAPKVMFAAQAVSHSQFGPIRAIGELDALPARATAFDPPRLDSLADLLFTTGTTGRPKGVRLTHRNIATSSRHINAVIQCREDDVEVLPLPLYHAFGLGRLRCNLIAGRTVVLVEGFRLPGEIFAALENHGATGLVGVPAGFAILLRFGSRGLGAFAGQLHHIEIGSAPMPLEHKHSLMEMLPNTELWMHYGLTEAARSAFIEFHCHRDHLDSVGLAAPGVAMEIRGDDGAARPRGELGLLWIGGQHISPGYWDSPDDTARAFADGWTCTGDVAHIDEAGFVHLRGRRDDMIKVGGFNVSPDEIERVLCQHAGVREAACVGVPDPRGIAGQVVLAFVVAAESGRQATDAELSDWVVARLEPYKVPTQYRWVDSVPRTASGKLVRRALREQTESAT